MKKLEEYEEICPDCKGRGFIITVPERFRSEIRNWKGKSLSDKTCLKCSGKGKILWIEKIINR